MIMCQQAQEAWERTMIDDSLIKTVNTKIRKFALVMHAQNITKADTGFMV